MKKQPKITADELLSAQTEAFDWGRLGAKHSEPPPKDSINIFDVIAKTGLSNDAAQRLLSGKLAAGELKSGKFINPETHYWNKYYWFPKKKK